MSHPLEGYRIENYLDDCANYDDLGRPSDAACTDVLDDDEYAAFCGKFAGEFPDLCDVDPGGRLLRGEPIGPIDSGGCSGALDGAS